MAAGAILYLVGRHFFAVVIGVAVTIAAIWLTTAVGDDIDTKYQVALYCGVGFVTGPRGCATSCECQAGRAKILVAGHNHSLIVRGVGTDKIFL